MNQKNRQESVKQELDDKINDMFTREKTSMLSMSEVSTKSKKSNEGQENDKIGKINISRSATHSIYDIKNEIGQCSFTRNS